MTSNVRQILNAPVEMRDGTILSADVYASHDAAPRPVVVACTPYNKNTGECVERAFTYVREGYAFVWIDARGRGDSDGTFIPYFNEGRDGHDAVEWAAAQGWSTGAVALWGWSYFGMAAWLTALEHPPNLQAMIIHGTPGNPHRDLPTGTTSPLHCCWHRMLDGRLAQRIESIDWNSVYHHLPLCDMDTAAGFRAPHWREHLSHPTLDSYWLPLCYQERFAEVDLPVLHVSGWYDDVHLTTLQNFVGMRREASTDRTRQWQSLLIGPWGHEAAAPALGEIDFGDDALIDLERYETAWLDAVLVANPDSVPAAPPVRFFVMGSNEWRDSTEWPPRQAAQTEFYLHSGGHANSSAGDGVLSQVPPQNEPPDRYRHDPERPVPFITDDLFMEVGGPDDYEQVERREDILIYTTAPFECPVEVIGPIELVLYASSPACDMDYMGKVVAVHEDGFCQRLCDGMVRARFRGGMTSEELLEPDRVYEFRIELWATAYRFHAGERLRLEVASSAFPKYDRNLATGEPLATGVKMVTATNVVWHAGDYASRMIVGLV